MTGLFSSFDSQIETMIVARKAEEERKKDRPKIIVRFRNSEDVKEFSAIFGINITDSTKVVEYPSNTFYTLNSEVDIKGTVLKPSSPKKYEFWKEMPEFIQDKKEAFKTVILVLNEINLPDLSEKLNQKITKSTKSIWFPKLIHDQNKKKRWVVKSEIERHFPKYPIYIVSKGRFKIRPTANYLERIRQPYHIIVEKSEYKQYKDAIDSKYGEILVLENEYKEAYNTCDDFGLERSTGPGPARNFAWQHSMSYNDKYHWVLDDNISDIFRLHCNERIRVESSVSFRILEDLVERFENVPVSGFNYKMFASPSDSLPPYVLNTRIYSCLLIKNHHRLWGADKTRDVYVWRGRYNEDTDLSLRVMGNHNFDVEPMPTIQLNAFLQEKVTTQKMGGGNTKEFYTKDDVEFGGTSLKSQMLARMHPNVCSNVWKFNRWHHHVDYSRFKHIKPILKSGLEIKDEIDNYGLELLTNYGN